jgi:hypothetical protein
MSEFVTITCTSGFGIAVGRLSRPVRGVGLLAMADAGLDTLRRIASVQMVSLGTVVLQLRMPRVAVGVIIARRCLPDGAEFTLFMMSETWELFSKDEGWNSDVGL